MVDDKAWVAFYNNNGEVFAVGELAWTSFAAESTIMYLGSLLLMMSISMFFK